MSPPRSPLAGGDEKSPLAAAMAPQPQPRPRPQPQSPVPPQQTQRISWMPMSPPRKSLLLSPLTKSPGVRRRSFSPRLRHEAAMKIQAMWRAYDTRQRMAHMVETLIRWIEEWRQKAAVQMQRIVRGFLSRCRYRQLLQNQIYGPSAIPIQALVRQFLGRRRWIRCRYEQHRWQAAVIIQARIRSWRLSRRYQYWIPIQRACIVVQAPIRGYLARRSYAVLVAQAHQVRCAIRMQAMARGYLCRQSYAVLVAHAHQVRCAIRIQSMARGYLCRQQVDELLKKAIFTTCLLRFESQKQLDAAPPMDAHRRVSLVALHPTTITPTSSRRRTVVSFVSPTMDPHRRVSHFGFQPSPPPFMDVQRRESF